MMPNWREHDIARSSEAGELPLWQRSRCVTLWAPVIRIQSSMESAHVTMGANGRLVIPARLRAALKMERGGALVASVENGAIRLEPLAEVIRRVQANVRRYVPEGSDLAAELSEDRRREAELE
jgi:bifunctional DNA-binding transcriptional regulator/antitoxin component of YhaV-PrlF toxin-antitoxin module